jgi:hypothetical protein
LSSSKNNKLDESYVADNDIEVSCFNCGNTVTMSVLKAEAMQQTGQEVYCEDCDDVDFDGDGSINFVPFF